MENDNSKIIELLQQNNKILSEIHNFQLAEKKSHDRKELINFILHSIPWIALVLISWFIFSTLFHYLEIMQSNINLLKDGFLNIQESFGKLIPDFSGVGDKIQNLWEEAKGVF